MKTLATAVLTLVVLLAAAPTAQARDARLKSDAAFAVIEAAANGNSRTAVPPVVLQRQSFGFWKVFDCVLAVAALVVGNSILIVKVKKAGGVVKFAKRVWQAKDAEQRLKVIGSVIGYVVGTGAAVKACTP